MASLVALTIALMTSERQQSTSSSRVGGLSKLEEHGAPKAPFNGRVAFFASPVSLKIHWQNLAGSSS